MPSPLLFPNWSILFELKTLSDIQKSNASHTKYSMQAGAFYKKEAGAPLSKDLKWTIFIRKSDRICNQSHLIMCRSSGAQSLSRIIFASFPPLVSRGPPIMQCNALPCTSRLATHNVFSWKTKTEISQTKRDQGTAVKWSLKIKIKPGSFFCIYSTCL